MKPSLIPGLLGASLALFGSPAFAQQDAPAAKKKQQRVVIKEQSKANEELLKKAAELSAKASELAAAGDSQAAARAAAKAAALLQEANQSKQNQAQRQRIRIEREKANEDRRLAEETRRAYERAIVIEAEKAHQHAHDHAHQHGEDVEKEVRIRIERAHEAMDRAHAEMEEHRVHIENLHERMALLNLEEGDHQIWVTPQIEELADGQLNLRIATELEKLNELDVLHTDLADAQAELRVRLGELHGLEGKEGAMIKLQGLADLQDLGEVVQLGDLAELGELAAIGKWVEKGDMGEFEVNIERLADIESMMPGLLELQGNAQAYALALPGGQHGIQGWVQKGSDCEGDCDCECEEADVQVRAFAFPGGQGHAKYLTLPEGKVQFGWSTEAPKAFSPQGNHFFHHGGDGEHEVHVFRSGEGGEIEIHGGNGHQTIIIEGRVIMNGQPAQGFEWNAQAPQVEGRYLFETDVNVQPKALFVPQPPKAPKAPKAPQAPKAPKAPLATPRVRFHGPEGEARVLQGRIVPGEAVDVFETEDGQEVRVRSMARPQPKDASAPAPSKARTEDMQKLVEEMRAEMEALRQELSDLRRQMKDDPLVQAQRRKSTERNALAVNPVAAVSDRRRAGLDR